MPLQVSIGRKQAHRLSSARSLARAAVVLLVLSLGLSRAVRGDGGIFTSTRHGDPTTGVHRRSGADFPRGACGQCHLQHASVDGAAEIAYPYGLFAPNDNDLCRSCHWQASDHGIYQGADWYDLGDHATSASMVWPGPTPFRRRFSDGGKCINCHDPHGQADASGLIPSLGLLREEELCLTCHDGSPAHSNIQSEFDKTYRHPVTTYMDRHNAAEDSYPSRFGTTNRHAECADCHNVHRLHKPAVPPSPPEASETLYGVSYVEVINGPAFTQPSYIFHTADDPEPVSYEYQLCFKCHSSWTVLPITSPSGRTPSDKAKEFNPNNLSYHPVEAAGQQTGVVMDNSLLSPYTASSVIACSDCHASDSSPALRGPHGSQHRYLLKHSYTTTEHSASYQGLDFALCYSCHSATALLSESETDTNFQFHRKHLEDVKGNQPFVPGCLACHGNTHGSANTRLVDFSQEPHLTSFTSWTSKETGAGIGQCTLVCHGETHQGEEY